VLELLQRLTRELSQGGTVSYTRRSILAGAVVLMLVLVPVAGASAPSVTITPFSSTRTIAASPDTCAFPIVVHSQGTFRESVFSNGRDATTVSDFHITWTNPQSGKSVHSALGGSFTAVSNGDGTATVTIDGNDGVFAAPGIGLFFGDVGRLVYIADESDLNTPLVVLQSTGHQDATLFPAVCEALA
jgi:hypothetical protein